MPSLNQLSQAWPALPSSSAEISTPLLPWPCLPRQLAGGTGQALRARWGGARATAVPACSARCQAERLALVSGEDAPRQR